VGRTAVAAVRLTLFGGFEAQSAQDHPVEIAAQKDRALLALLTLSPGARHSRDKLASLLWSDRGDRQARDSLKHALSRLRQCLKASPSALVTDREWVRVDPAVMTADVPEFERLVAEGTTEALERATALYRGDLLDGIGVRDAAFEEWLLVERQRLRQSAEAALTQLMTQALAAGARDRAAAAARRLFALDPLRESACRALMRILAEQGQGAQALRLYETLRDRLHAELGVKPEAETVRLYEDIRSRRIATPTEPPAGVPALQSPPESLPLPSKPSIAVLPFQNLSGDAEQDYFADGMVEEIITALSRIRWLFVIARNSSFTYKARAVDVKQIGRELGVRYVLEGSVRKAGNKVRIAGQLVDATTGVHLWADRFDGTLEDIFDLQEQVTSRVVGAIAPMLEQAEIERAKNKPTGSMDAYDYYLRGIAAVHRWTREANDEALSMFRRAIELDPNFASAYGMAARCYSQRKVSAWVIDRESEIAETTRLARRAADLGRYDAVALAAAGMALGYVAGDLEACADLIDRGLSLNPNLAWAWLFSGWAKIWMGKSEAALEDVARAMRLSPHDPQFFNMQAAAGMAHLFAGRYGEAFSWAEMSVRDNPHHVLAACTAAAASALAGRPPEAQRAIARLRELDPSLKISNLGKFIPLRRADDFETLVSGLRKAGLPE
jgi:TolB-like protein/DNA-binding SARP family transcriptional activator